MALRILLVDCLIVVLLMIAISFGCKDIGSEPSPLQPPQSNLFGIEKETFYILVSNSDSGVISGGTPPYVVIYQSDTMKAKASISGSSLSIAARSVGLVTIIIGDNGTPQLRDTVRTIVYSVSYSSQVQPIFDQNCAFSGCHASGGIGPFSLQASVSWGSMVNVQAITGSCRPIFRVKPFSADSSALYLRIEGRCDAQMPLGGGGGLPVTQRSTIRNWINEGALQN